MSLRRLCLVVIIGLSGCSSQGITESDDLSAEAMPVQLDCSSYPSSKQRKTYSWVDEDGVRHYDDGVPPKYTPEELEIQKELQRRVDKELLEYECRPDPHDYTRCDQCVALMTAHVRVTELYIHNLERKLTELEERAKCCAPYNSDPDAPKADDSLLGEICETRESIKRHTQDLVRFRSACPDLTGPDSQLIADFDIGGQYSAGE